MLNAQFLGINYSLKTQQRLNQAADFKCVFQAGKKLDSRYFTLYSKLNTFKYARLGLVVAKKNVRYATQRNQIKRIIKESFRLHQHDLASKDIVVVVKASVRELNKTKLRIYLDNLWLKLIPISK